MIGVLALQGAFSKHRHMLQKIGLESFEVRYPHELQLCTGLILPGGESTAMLRIMEGNGLLEPLKSFSKPLFGTCAGLILMAKLNLLNIEIERNAYGRQSASFSIPLSSSFGQIQGVFIRAPRICNLLSQEIEVLAFYNETPVLIQQHNRIGATFHPELTDDPSLHAYFSELCKTNQAFQSKASV